MHVRGRTDADMTYPTVPCQACGEPLIPVDGCVVHPGCPLPGMSGYEENPDANALKERLTRMVQFVATQQPRSLQISAGPSDMTTACDRRIGYKLAGIGRVNFTTDPWPAIVGTAAHAWLEEATKIWTKANPTDSAWHTEVSLKLDETFPAHSDLYLDGTVVDYKTMSADRMKQVKNLGIAAVPGYFVQVQLYGLAFRQAGWPVQRVGMAFLPRSGSLRSMMTWVGKYEEKVARAALDRVYRIAARLADLEILDNPHRWEQVDATPGDACGLCPLYSPDKILESGADDTGCPGR